MALNDEIIPARKAFSAEKSKDIYESQSSDSGLDEIANKTFKACSSASYLSARERRHAQKALDCALQEQFSPRYLKIHNRENQKLFLQSSKILEKLSKIAVKTEVHSLEDATGKRKLSLRKIVLYHDKLKKLLVEKSTIMLLEECDVSIKRTEKLIEDFKHLYLTEKLKMTTMPIQAFNRFISSSDINVSALELLIKKLKIICDVHSSLNSNYQKMVNLFHINTNIELNKAVLKANRLLNKLKTDVFFWSHKCIQIFMQKLCLADPNSVSPDFLQSILKAMHVYNSFIREDKVAPLEFSRTCYIFYDFIIQREYSAVSFESVLKYLSFLEAKVAAERIVNFLTSSCKKYRQTDLKRKSLADKEIQKGDTSDYSSVAISENEAELTNLKTSAIITPVSGFVNVLLAIMQRNQSLILKYMYAITSLESVLLLKNKRNFENRTPNSSARQMWDLPQLYNKDESYSHLEEGYWTNFWNNSKKFILKHLFDVPYHQYGDSAAGTVILWPYSFLQILSESLKISAENKDLSLEGRCIMKQIYDYLLIYQTKLLWDKEFSSALPSTQSHLCHPVPTFQNQVSTHPGNSLNKCLEVLLVIFSEDVHQMDSILYLSVFLHLQATLDTYVLWVNIKTRALIASQNLPTYLLISSSDCNSALLLLEAGATSLISELSSSIALRRSYPSQIFLHKTILMQIDVLCGYVSEATIIIHEFCFTAVKEMLQFVLKNASIWKNCTNIKNKSLAFDTMNDIFSPMTEVLKHLFNLYPIILSITSAVSEAFLFVLNSIKNYLNNKNTQILSMEHLKFLQWLDKLDLHQPDMEKLKQSHYFRKFECTLKLIQDFNNRPKSCLKKRNRIVPQSQLEVFPVESILSEEERIYWQELCSKSPFLPCL